MPWKVNRNRLLSLLINDFKARGLVYLRGLKHELRPGTDVDLPFRQCSPFLYCTGLEEENDAHLVLDLDAKTSHLFLSVLSEDDIVWVGQQKPLTAYEGFDSVKASTELDAFISSRKPEIVHCLPSALCPHVAKEKTKSDVIDEALTRARMVKSNEELELMRRANKVSSETHRSLMQFCRSQEFAKNPSELTLMAHWYSQCMKNGLMVQAYLPIVGYGPHAAILHYKENNAPIPANGDNFLLVDAGAELHGYASDITRTYPVSGKFSERQRNIYQLVLDAQMAVLEKIRAGVEYETLHRLATEIICRGLLKCGILQHPSWTTSPDTAVSELCWTHYVTAVFFPHGLGHLIGLDVHDVGGYPKGIERIQKPGIRYLRLRRVLEPGFVVTIEPGCYFVDALIDKALKDPVQSKFINAQVLEQYRPLGGVRIEDCVVVTETGHENLTSAPKTIPDIEAVMAAAK